MVRRGAEVLRRYWRYHGGIRKIENTSTLTRLFSALYEAAEVLEVLKVEIYKRAHAREKRSRRRHDANELLRFLFCYSAAVMPLQGLYIIAHFSCRIFHAVKRAYHCGGSMP